MNNVEPWRALTQRESDFILDYFLKEKRKSLKYVVFVIGFFAIVLLFCAISSISSEEGFAIKDALISLIPLSIFSLFFVWFPLYLYRSCNKKEILAIKNGLAVICKAPVISKTEELSYSNGKTRTRYCLTVSCEKETDAKVKVPFKIYNSIEEGDICLVFTSNTEEASEYHIFKEIS